MSQLVLDDQLDFPKIAPGLERWTSWERLQSIRPGEHVFDERVPEILLTLNRPTFVTIDHGFWNRRLCHSGYCILFFQMATHEQQDLPDLMRRLFHLPEFHTRAVRMGKVARVHKTVVTYWEAGERKILALPELD